MAVNKDSKIFILLLIINLFSFCLAIATSFLIDDLLGIFLHNAWILVLLFKVLYYWKFLIEHVTYKMFFLTFVLETAVVVLYIVYWSLTFSKLCRSEKSVCSTGLANMIIFIIIYTMDICMLAFMFVPTLKNRRTIHENDNPKNPVAERRVVEDEESNRGNHSTNVETRNDDVIASTHNNNNE